VCQQERDTGGIGLELSEMAVDRCRHLIRIAAAMWCTHAGMLAVVREMERGVVTVAQAAASLRYVFQRGA
jgi:hypothetical protein